MHALKIYALLFLSLSLAPSAYADNADFVRCARKFPENNIKRLKCFDNALRLSVSTRNLGQDVNTLHAQHEQQELLAHEVFIKAQRRLQRAQRSYLTRAWNLDNRNHSDQNSLDRLQPYKLNYLIIRKTSNTNTQPGTPAVGHNVLIPYDLDVMETKFQLSFKTDIATQENLNILGLKTVRLWGAYTQQSNWQMFNTRNSSPFRETNYEPELIAAFGTGNARGWKLLNLGFVHQSNGRSNPGSRSWNRLYAQGGWEWGNTSLMARAWWRIPENALKDDNPDIIHYMGRGDVVLRWEPDSKSQAVSVLLRNNLNFNQNFGFMQLDWALPFALGKAARLHVQITNGYGASLIDYNHRQTTFGLGVSFREW